MIYTRQQAADNIRNQDGKSVFYLADGDRLTEEARDYLSSRRIPILPASQAKPERYRTQNGAYFLEKPEYMTHLCGDILVSKTDSRIRFRGAMDTLEAELLLCMQAVVPFQTELGDILQLCRQIVRCEVMNELLRQPLLCGLTQQQIRQQSHFPQQYFATPHFMPTASDAPSILQLNRVRCIARQAELAAAEAFCPPEKVPTHTDILQALNRVSSMLYILMCRVKGHE